MVVFTAYFLKCTFGLCMCTIESAHSKYRIQYYMCTSLAVTSLSVLLLIVFISFFLLSKANAWLISEFYSCHQHCATQLPSCLLLEKGWFALQQSNSPPHIFAGPCSSRLLFQSPFNSIAFLTPLFSIIIFTLSLPVKFHVTTIVWMSLSAFSFLSLFSLHNPQHTMDQIIFNSFLQPEFKFNSNSVCIPFFHIFISISSLTPHYLLFSKIIPETFQFFSFCCCFLPIFFINMIFLTIFINQILAYLPLNILTPK